MKRLENTNRARINFGQLRLTKRFVPLRIRLTSLILVLVLMSSIALGTPLHSSDRGCNMPMQMPGCEHMGMEPSAPGMTPMALCCLLDCSDQGPVSNSFSVQAPKLNVATVYPVLPVLYGPKPLRQAKWLETPSFTSPDTYLKNLALLI